MSTTRAKLGERKLSEVARHVVRPSGIVATEWWSVRKICRDKLGVTFDGWQEGAGQLILAKRADGKLAAMIGGVGMSIPRQIGKTYLLAGLIFGLCIKRPGLLVIWSAHHARTHGETFIAMQGFADRLRVKPYIRQIFTGSGDEEVRFQNGSRILFGARERGFGRGIPGVDVLVMDEAQILSDKALENMLATLNTSQFGLQLYVGTPPKPGDDAEAFTRMRTEALDTCPADGLPHKCPESEDAVWIECGADRGAAIDDRKQWAKANPSFPHRTPVESMLRMRKKLKPEGFMREGLGIWDEGALDPILQKILARWPTLAVAVDSGTPSAVAYAVDVAPDWSRATICAAGARGDGRRLVWVVDSQPGTRWIIPALLELQNSKGLQKVSVDTRPSGAALIPQIEAAGVDVDPVTTQGVAKACGAWFEATQSGELAHLDDPLLNGALAVAATKPSGTEGAWVWTRKGAGNISPLVGGTLAFAASYDIPAGFFAAWR